MVKVSFFPSLPVQVALPALGPLYGGLLGALGEGGGCGDMGGPSGAWADTGAAMASTSQAAGKRLRRMAFGIPLHYTVYLLVCKDKNHLVAEWV